LPWLRLRGPDDARRDARGGNAGQIDDDGVGVGVDHAGRARGCAASVDRSSARGPTDPTRHTSTVITRISIIAARIRSFGFETKH
jgi:hypothetical protein